MAASNQALKSSPASRKRKVSKATTNKKRLRFSETSQLIVYRNPNPNNTNDPLSSSSSSWYTKQERDQSKHELKTHTLALRRTPTPQALEQIAVHIVNGSASPENVLRTSFQSQEHMRGLERGLSPAVCLCLERGRKVAIKRVLEEQARQRGERAQRQKDPRGDGSEEALGLARVSMEASSFARQWSFWIANLRE